jgi:hypothetical protein
MTAQQLQRIKDIEKHMGELRDECEQECASLTKERIKILSTCDHKKPDGTSAAHLAFRGLGLMSCEICWEPLQGSVLADANT